MTTHHIPIPLKLASSIALLALSSAVSAVTVDFDTLERSNADINRHGEIYSEDGFTLTSNSRNGLASWGNSSNFYTGSTALFNNATDGLTTLTHDSGDPFSIQSIDLAELNAVTDVSVTFLGSHSDGTSVDQTFTLNGIIAEAQTFFFGALFSDLISLSWRQQHPGSHSFDNLVLNELSLPGQDSQDFVTPSAVPVPAAIWLFGSALIGLFGFNLRNKATRA